MKNLVLKEIKMPNQRNTSTLGAEIRRVFAMKTMGVAMMELHVPNNPGATWYILWWKFSVSWWMLVRHFHELYILRAALVVLLSL